MCLCVTHVPVQRKDFINNGKSKSRTLVAPLAGQYIKTS